MVDLADVCDDGQGLWLRRVYELLLCAEQITHIYMVSETHMHVNTSMRLRGNTLNLWLMSLYQQQGETASDNQKQTADQLTLQTSLLFLKAADTTSYALSHHVI